MSSAPRRLFDSATSSWHSLKGEVQKDIKEAKANLAEANDNFKTPAFENIGGEYEATFSQPLAGSRVYFSTPDLLAGSALPGMSLYASSVHEASHSTNDGENQEKIEGTFRWTDTIGPALVEKPVVTHGPVRVNLAWTRPMHVDSLVYTALPLGATTAKPTIKLAADVTDLKTNITLGFVSRLCGTEFVHSLLTRGRYGTIGLALQNSQKSPDLRSVSGNVSSTLWRDSLKDRSISAGLTVQSANFDGKASSMPSALNGITLKAEYDQRQVTVDTTIQATQAGSDMKSFKLSEAHVRAIYAHNLGLYPRWCAGASVGVTSSVDGDSRIGSLSTPSVSSSFYYQLNPNNKWKITADSTKRVRSTYEYALTSNVLFCASLNTLFPNFEGKSVDSTLTSMKPTLGFSVRIGAE